MVLEVKDRDGKDHAGKEVKEVDGFHRVVWHTSEMYNVWNVFGCVVRQAELVSPVICSRPEQ